MMRALGQHLIVTVFALAAAGGLLTAPTATAEPSPPVQPRACGAGLAEPVVSAASRSILDVSWTWAPVPGADWYYYVAFNGSAYVNADGSAKPGGVIPSFYQVSSAVRVTSPAVVVTKRPLGTATPITGIQAAVWPWRSCDVAPAGLLPESRSALVIPFAVPGPATSVQASAASSVNVSWQAPANLGGTASTLYVVSSTPSGLACNATNSTACTIPLYATTHAGAYTFSVTTIADGIQGAVSTPSAAVDIRSQAGAAAKPAVKPATKPRPVAKPKPSTKPNPLPKPLQSVS